MKKVVLALIVTICLLAFSFNIFAADVTYRITHGDDSQDALLIGKIISVKDEYIIFDVIRTVNGTPAKSPFKLSIPHNSNAVPYHEGGGILAFCKIR